MARLKVGNVRVEPPVPDTKTEEGEGSVEVAIEVVVVVVVVEEVDDEERPVRLVVEAVVVMPVPTSCLLGRKAPGKSGG